MGSLCGGAAVPTNPRDPHELQISLEQFPDPFSEMRAKVILELEVRKTHGPSNYAPLDRLPHQLIKKQSILQQKFRQPLVLSPNAYLLPPYEISKGCYYFGQWFKGQKEGYGKLYYPDQTYYSGEFKNDVFEGKGRLHHSNNADYYIGQWRNNKPHGSGTFQSAAGARYEGEWVEAKKQGEGKQTYPDATIFQGRFEASQKRKGTFFYNNGENYTGELKGDKRHGRGTMQFRDGRKYQGQWMDDEMHGQGVFTWNSGQRYQGAYFQGQKHGKGKMIYADGSYFQGEWKQGWREGNGFIVTKDQTRIEGTWKNDVKV